MTTIEATMQAISPQAERPLLKIERLRKEFPVRTGLLGRAAVSAVDDISFEVREGTTVGIVGESGCGKSTTARLVLGLIEPDGGEIIFGGRNIAGLRGPARKSVAREMQMVFQDPYSALNPRSTIGESIAFPMRIHGVNRKESRERAADLLAKVGLAKAHSSYYPHQMSGGQRQRVNIARAVALNPKLVIADEAVSALDKSVQAQVLNLLSDLQESLGLTYLFISHDLNVVQYMATRVIVMYLGQVVEDCESRELYSHPLHPYTQALLASVPDVDPDLQEPGQELEGEIPSPLNPPSGCRFRTRCPIAEARCAESRPQLREVASGHYVACHLVAGTTAA
ncbi:MAG TPA: ABC transporter ATP-binding protein [Dehalococcoidia bacterium]|nr:ABC transporter ATP-binding protein [Dehalococcoidia bacterium]